MKNPKEYIFKTDTLDLFELSNTMSRYIIQNKKARLSTEFQVSIKGKTKFADYMKLVDAFNQAWFSVRTTTYYQGKGDPDAITIRQKQEAGWPEELKEEFPMRIREIIQIEVN